MPLTGIITHAEGVLADATARRERLERQAAGIACGDGLRDYATGAMLATRAAEAIPAALAVEARAAEALARLQASAERIAGHVAEGGVEPLGVAQLHPRCRRLLNLLPGLPAG